ncbi:PREDICTED: uncharacterized protein LOC108565166 isoform X2 [Nicrophorus vespilloides]|nr:PREDICTED: uncharacterized protein LOC108565166 isoform X2 [Nicrophorus vespilloides]XP_017779968.1 PREDICTED: uncharacterized protein LOC108565166 isoform X2 [Nicrophorus vespilloides]
MLFAGSWASTSTSYQYVKFVNNNSNKGKQGGNAGSNRPQQNRNARSFTLPVEFLEETREIWAENLFPYGSDNFLDVSLNGYFNGGETHHTPDFSNGLAYPDPLLLTGLDARRAVNYIYGRGELFYNDIPHARAILRVQEERKLNGLPPNRLGSLNYRSPFYRGIKKPFFF